MEWLTKDYVLKFGASKGLYTLKESLDAFQKAVAVSFCQTSWDKAYRKLKQIRKEG